MGTARETVPVSADCSVWLALYLADQRPLMTPGGPLWWTLRSTPAPLSYHAMRAVYDGRMTARGPTGPCTTSVIPPPARMLADPAFTLVDAQTVRRHTSVTTTKIYTQPRLEDLVGKILEHYARPPVPGPTIEPSYDAAAVRELLGLPPT